MQNACKPCARTCAHALFIKPGWEPPYTIKQGAGGEGDPLQISSVRKTIGAVEGMLLLATMGKSPPQFSVLILGR